MSGHVSNLPRREPSARQTETLERLLTAARDELDEVGHEALTIRTVAARAEVSTATAYNYFASRDHLFAELFWRHLDTAELSALVGESSTERLQQATRHLAETIAAAPTLASAATKSLLGSDPDVGGLRRYTVEDPWHGRFELAHCGALMDVEPMGPDYVRTMCHDIGDPTFDATAVATNAKAQVRPIHRPPRASTDTLPHFAWTVVIDESHEPVAFSEGCLELQGSRAASVELGSIDAAGPGMSDYSGALLSDLDFAEFSHSALVRLADEVCLQMHLLDLGFVRAVSLRLPEEEAHEICVKQLTGIAGVAARRIHRALGLSADLAGARQVLELHPLFNPTAYVHVQDGAVTTSPAHEDGGWISLVGPTAKGAAELRPLQAIVRAVDPTYDVTVDGSPESWSFEVFVGEAPARESGEVAVTRFSSGASFSFEPRMGLPISPA